MPSSPFRRRRAPWACGALVVLVSGCAGSTSSSVGTVVTAAPTAATTAAATTAAPTTAPAPTTAAAARSTAAPTTATPPTTAATVAPAATPAAAAGTTAITVDSTAAQYFVLYLRPVVAGTAEIPVAIAKGQAGRTTLTDGRRALSADHYRVATFDVAEPGDVDGDGTDDLTELADPRANPLNPAPKLEPAVGAIVVPDVATYSDLSYQGNNVGRDSYLAGLEVMKFIIAGTNTAHPAIYFMNTNNYNAHPPFASMVGIQGVRGPSSPGIMRGDVVYEPNRTAADGTKGVYRFAFQPSDAYRFADIALAYEVLTTNMPFLQGKLSYYAFAPAAYPVYEREKAQYDAYGRVAVIKGA